MVADHFIAQYGYAAVLVGSFFEGETVLLLGGLAAKLGHLQLVWVIAAAFVGTLCGDQLYFFLGRHFGRRWLLRKPHWRRKAARLDELIARWGVLLILVFRFMYGVRTVAILVFGMSDISIPRFAALNAMGALIWAIAVGSLGYFFGHGVDWLLQANTEQRLIAMGMAAMVALALWWYCARHIPARSMARGSVAVPARVAARRARVRRRYESGHPGQDRASS